MVFLLQAALALACTNPVDYGAVPSDGNDDSVAFQTAIAAVPTGGTLCVTQPGSYQFSRQPKAWNRFAAINYHGKGMTVACSPGTSLDLVGDQGFKSTILFAVDPGAENPTIDGCTVTSRGAWNTDEQTHMIATTKECSPTLGTCTPIKNLKIINNTCDHPRSEDPTIRNGDCIRLLGDTEATRVDGVIIAHNRLSGARAGIEFQRGVRNVEVWDNDFPSPTADQHIDGEASGVGSGFGLEVMNVNIHHNRFPCGAKTQGDYDISMTSGVNIHIHHNTTCRGIKIVKSTRVEIDNETIRLNARSNEGAIEVSNGSELHLHDNVVVRTGGVAGAVVRIVGHGTSGFTTALLERNILIQGTDWFGVYTENTDNLHVDDNKLVWLVQATQRTAVYAKGTIQPVRGLQVTNNVVAVGSTLAVVALDSSRYPVVTPRVTDNDGAGAGACVGRDCP